MSSPKFVSCQESLYNLTHSIFHLTPTPHRQPRKGEGEGVKVGTRARGSRPKSHEMEGRGTTKRSWKTRTLFTTFFTNFNDLLTVKRPASSSGTEPSSSHSTRRVKKSSHLSQKQVLSIDTRCVGRLHQLTQHFAQLYVSSWENI